MRVARLRVATAIAIVRAESVHLDFSSAAPLHRCAPVIYRQHVITAGLMAPLFAVRVRSSRIRGGLLYARQRTTPAPRPLPILRSGLFMAR